MRIVVFGYFERWEMAVDIILKYRPDIQIVGLSNWELGPYKDAEATVTLEEAKKMYDAGMIDAIVNVSGEHYVFWEMIEKIGFKEIYVLPIYIYQQDKEGKFTIGEEIIYPYKEIKPELLSMEFHLADHCNLNCKGCAHFSNLVPEPVFADLEQFEKDCRRLSELFSNIQQFFLLGGEPLLNKNISSFIKVARNSFPYARICIVTNGLLMLSLSRETIEAIHDYNVEVSVSAYNCLDVDKIKKFANNNKIITDYRMEKGGFTKYINLKGDSDAKEMFEHCPRRSCFYLDKGSIAACAMPFVVKYFNQYFNESILENEGIDLYHSNLDGWEILKRLFSPMDTCKYCGEPVPFRWEIAKAPFDKTDWCI